MINFRVRDKGRGQIDTLDISCLEPKKSFDQYGIKDILNVTWVGGYPSFCHSIRTQQIFDKLFRSPDKTGKHDLYIKKKNY